MPRPAKCRRVCHYPKTAAFSPAPVAELRPPVVLTVDEYEAIRLIDAEGFSQEQCSQSMEIARTTVQKIYESARKKLAAMLVEGRPLQIEGGAFRLCDGRGAPCGCPGCYKRQIGAQYQKPEGEQVMRIAIPYENGQVFQHFGHTQKFKIYDTDGEAVTASQIVDTEGQGHGALAGLLSALQVDVLVCGGIGEGAKSALAAANIRLYGGVCGEADTAANALLAGLLEYDPAAHCAGHGEDGSCGGHGESGSCGGHGEGGSCGGHCGRH